MNGQDHYAEAERLLARAKTSTDDYYGAENDVPTLLAALVHAVLANTAVAALGNRGAEERRWLDVAGSDPGDGDS
jgi:hypothetical protein